MNTFSSIDLDYRVQINKTFVVSLNGLILCVSRTPVLDSACILREAGVTDDTIITMSPDGSDQVGMIYFIPSATDGFVQEPTEA
jgi:hypothetical protein